MRVISVPRGLRTAGFAFLLTIPLAALHMVVASRAPWWHLPYRNIAIASLVAFILSMSLAWAFVQGRRWALPLAVAFSSAWILGSGWIALRMRHVTLAYFTLFLAFSLWVLLSLLKRELGRSFFDARLAWYEGLPKPLAGLVCQLQSGGKKADFKVSRLDREGAFIFAEGKQRLSNKEFRKLSEDAEMVFRFRDREVRCKAIPRTILGRGLGGGFQFAGNSTDHLKSLGDFIEGLRGEGYEQ